MGQYTASHSRMGARRGGVGFRVEDRRHRQMVWVEVVVAAVIETRSTRCAPAATTKTGTTYNPPATDTLHRLFGLGPATANQRSATTSDLQSLHAH